MCSSCDCVYSKKQKFERSYVMMLLIALKKIKQFVFNLLVRQYLSCLQINILYKPKSENVTIIKVTFTTKMSAAQHKSRVYQ